MAGDELEAPVGGRHGDRQGRHVEHRPVPGIAGAEGVEGGLAPRRDMAISIALGPSRITSEAKFAAKASDIVSGWALSGAGIGTDTLKTEVRTASTSSAANVAGWARCSPASADAASQAPAATTASDVDSSDQGERLHQARESTRADAKALVQECRRAGVRGAAGVGGPLRKLCVAGTASASPSTPRRPPSRSSTARTRVPLNRTPCAACARGIRTDVRAREGRRKFSGRQLPRRPGPDAAFLRETSPIPARPLRAGTPFAMAWASPAMFFANHFFEPAPPRPTPPPGTLWTLIHETEGSVSVNVGAHPHGYELRLVLNQRFLRSRVHESLSGVLADATDTRTAVRAAGILRSRNLNHPLTRRACPRRSLGEGGLFDQRGRLRVRIEQELLAVDAGRSRTGRRRRPRRRSRRSAAHRRGRCRGAGESRTTARRCWRSSGSRTGHSTSTRRSRLRSIRSALPMNTSGSPPFSK